MEKFLREWRQDALNKAQYESAIFVGDKLLAMTSKCDRASAQYPMANRAVLQTTITTHSG